MVILTQGESNDIKSVVESMQSDGIENVNEEIVILRASGDYKFYDLDAPTLATMSLDTLIRALYIGYKTEGVNA